jgi:hypothetical protein
VNDASTDAIAFLTCWFANDRDLALRVGEHAINGHPTEFLDGLGAIVQVLHDVAAEGAVDLSMVLRSVAIGIAHEG